MTILKQGPALRLKPKLSQREPLSKEEKAKCRAIRSMHKLFDKYPDEALATLLEDAHFWPKNLASDVAYHRYDDDTRMGGITLNFSRDGDSWIAVVPDPGEGNVMHRFRTFNGGGRSLRTQRALVFLAVAIDLDNREHPQNRKP